MRASACASVVLPTPGMSSISRWPRASRQARHSRSCCSLPRMMSPRPATAASTSASGRRVALRPAALMRCSSVLHARRGAASARRAAASCRSNSAMRSRSCATTSGGALRDEVRVAELGRALVALLPALRAPLLEARELRGHVVDQAARTAPAPSRPSMMRDRAGRQVGLRRRPRVTDSRLPTRAMRRGQRGDRLGVALAAPSARSTGVARECGTSSSPRIWRMPSTTALHASDSAARRRHRPGNPRRAGRARA